MALMTDPVPAPRREQDLERALREAARVADEVASGLLRGLLEMQADVIRRLEEVERRATELESQSRGGVRAGNEGDS
jgi:hypothetical protein